MVLAELICSKVMILSPRIFKLNLWAPNSSFKIAFNIHHRPALGVKMKDPKEAESKIKTGYGPDNPGWVLSDC